MKHKLFIVILLTVFQQLTVYAQQDPFNIHIESVEFNNLGGLQSFAVAQYEDKWLILGGRLDGLHRRQPFASFDISGNNNQIFVVDPINKQKWSTGLSSLPVNIQEQLSSTNMEFIQDGDYLYALGGYGYSNTHTNHITFPYLTAIHVSGLMNAIINKLPINSYFQQISDTLFAVTGGYLNKIYDKFYLTGGHKFIGKYNPQGPSHGPGFSQAYTNSIRIFTVANNGSKIDIKHEKTLFDSFNLHRRDYNVVPQISPSGEQSLTAFSGVFQSGIDLPFLSCVNIDSSGYAVDDQFSQYYNHYHCAHLPLYSTNSREMHTVFFGGISQYFDSAGILTKDNNVPFVKTIARVTRDSNGKMSEYKLPNDIPCFLGAGSEFIRINGIPHFDNEVIDLDKLTDDTTLVGYIYGGISSSAANIFFTNTGSQSVASSQIFKVFITKNSLGYKHDFNSQSTNSLRMQVFPNSNNGEFSISFHLDKNEPIALTLSDINGKVFEKTTSQILTKGQHTINYHVENQPNTGIYFIRLATPTEIAVQKLIID